MKERPVERSNAKAATELSDVRTDKSGWVREPGEKQKAGEIASATSTGWFNNGWI
jgi:hypothetical protein